MRVGPTRRSTLASASTATPEWVDEDDVDANAPASGSGMEREPDL